MEQLHAARCYAFARKIHKPRREDISNFTPEDLAKSYSTKRERLFCVVYLGREQIIGEMNVQKSRLTSNKMIAGTAVVSPTGHAKVRLNPKISTVDNITCGSVNDTRVCF